MSIGDKLKTERERKGMSVEDIHSQLRIHPDVIRQLEENKFESLPAPIYTRGFLKRYGEFLSLNPQELLNEYEAMDLPEKKQSFVVQTTKKGAPTSALFPDLAIRPSAEKIKPYLRYLLLAVAVLFVAYILIKAFGLIGDRFGRPGTMVQTQPMALFTEPTDIEKQKQLVRSIRKNSPYLFSVGQRNYPKIVPAEPVRLEIRATTAVWLRVSADGEIVFESILQKGQFRTWSANKSLDVHLGRPEGVLLTVNGAALGGLPEPGAKHILVSRQGVRRL